MRRRILCLLLLLSLMLALLPQMTPKVQAAVKTEKVRSIGIVFDNSGSMYSSGGKGIESWCRATYAMEVFASMMNEGDQLRIYPMHKITLGKNGTQEYTDSAPLVINGPSEANKIREIYTPVASGTPFDAVIAGYNDMLQTNADEKYLIILTDGAFDGAYRSVANVTTQLNEYSKDMNVMFLGIGNVSIPSVTNSAKQYYDKASSSAEVLTKLTAMCNRIFGRDTLSVSGKNVTFDVSMSKMIVFIQGKDLSNVTLSGGTPKNSHNMRYGELGAGNKDHFKIDYSLQGVIAIYENLDAGTYELNYTGNADSVSVYYEPDVDLKIQLLDEGGTVIDSNSSELYAGTYTLTYGIVDRHGNPTNSKLLKNVKYDLVYTVGGQEYHIQETRGGQVEIDLPPESELDGKFTVQYLDDYTIKKDGNALGWPGGKLNIQARPVDQFLMEVTGGSNSYKLSNLEQEASYFVKFFNEGEQLTGDKLDAVQFEFSLEGSNAKYEVNRETDGYRVKLKYNGSVSETNSGSGTAVFSSGFTNQDGQTGKAKTVRKNFEIADDGLGVGLELQFEQKYYVISDINESAPIVIKLTMGGVAMTAEQFEATAVEFTIDGLQYDIQPNPEESCYIVTLKGEGDIQKGNHEIHCSAKGVDSLGRPSSAEASDKINCQPYALWFKILSWVVLIIAILLLIWMYMNMKVLPKDIKSGPGNFNVDGDMIPGNIKCSFAGKNKRTGSVRVESPMCATNPMARCGVTLELEAISPRRTKSAARRIRVRNVRALNPATTTSLQVGSFQMIKDPTSNKLVRAGGNPDAPINFTIGNNVPITVTAEIMDMSDGNEVTCSLTVPLKFY